MAQSYQGHLVADHTLELLAEMASNVDHAPGSPGPFASTGNVAEGVRLRAGWGKFRVRSGLEGVELGGNGTCQILPLIFQPTCPFLCTKYLMCI